MDFSKKVINLAKGYNITEQDVMFCHIVASGGDPADAYLSLFCDKKDMSAHQAEVRAQELLISHPGMKVLINKLKMRKPAATKEAYNEAAAMDAERAGAEELSSREGLVKFLRKNLAMTEGKDAVSAAVTLAKLEGYDKEKRDDADRVHYFLPWVSDCRGCQLMRIAVEVCGDSITPADLRR